MATEKGGENDEQEEEKMNYGGWVCKDKTKE